MENIQCAAEEWVLFIQCMSCTYLIAD